MVWNVVVIAVPRRVNEAETQHVLEVTAHPTSFTKLNSSHFPMQPIPTPNPHLPALAARTSHASDAPAASCRSAAQLSVLLQSLLGPSCSHNPHANIPMHPTLIPNSHPLATPTLATTNALQLPSAAQLSGPAAVPAARPRPPAAPRGAAARGAVHPGGVPRPRGAAGAAGQRGVRYFPAGMLQVRGLWVAKSGAFGGLVVHKATRTCCLMRRALQARAAFAAVLQACYM